MEIVTVTTPAVVTNRYGDDELDWGSASSVDVRCIVAPRSSSENNENRSALQSGLTLLVPASAAVITHNARVVARGETWEVDGDDADWVSPWGWEPGREVHLRRVAG